MIINFFEFLSPDDLVNCYDENKTKHSLLEGVNILEKAYLRADKRCREGIAEWKDYLLLLRLLPHIIIAIRYQFLPATKDEEDFIIRVKTTYSTLSDWIGYLVTGDEPPNFELFFTDSIKSKPRAELSIAVLNLAIELFPRCEELQERFTSPADCWFGFEVQAFDAAILESGLVTGIGLISGSKEAFNDNFLDLSEWFSGKRELKAMERSSAVGCLVSNARAMGIKDSTFRKSKAFIDFEEELYKQMLRYDKGNQATAFENGVPLPKGQHANPATRKKNKDKYKAFGM
jgi:hypothetical protein